MALLLDVPGVSAACAEALEAVPAVQALGVAVVAAVMRERAADVGARASGAPPSSTPGAEPGPVENSDPPPIVPPLHPDTPPTSETR